MAKLSKELSRTIVWQFFLKEGWLPAGTDEDEWEAVTLDQVEFDQPPIAQDPHFQKKKAAAALQYAFSLLNANLKSPLAELKKSSNTVGEVADWCAANQS